LNPAIALLAIGLWVTPAAAATVPGAPRSGAATPGSGSATVTWQAPAANGGAPVDRYRVVWRAPGVAEQSVPTGPARRSLTITGLTPGTNYTFRVQAHNRRGWSNARTATAVPKARAGFGAFHGTCGGVASQLGRATPSLFTDRSLDFGTDAYDDPADRARLTPGGQTIITTPNLGGSSAHSEVFAYEALARCESASLLKTEAEIVYDRPGAVTDLIVQIAGSKVGVNVMRAVTVPPGPMTSSTATALLTHRLNAVNRSSDSVSDADAWVKQILVVLAYDQQHANMVVSMWKNLDAAIEHDTVVYVVVTNGEDQNVYLNG